MDTGQLTKKILFTLLAIGLVPGCVLFEDTSFNPGEVIADMGEDAAVEADQGVEDSGPCPDGGSLNSCGGCGTLEGEPGDPCGSCGTYTCVSEEAVGCFDESAPNECGGCGFLEETLGAPCGPCGLDTYICDGEDALTCSGETTVNSCGGCEPLEGESGASCGPCDNGTWTCDGTELISCEGADVDFDQDGHCSLSDCNDRNSQIHPDAEEACDGWDNDCDGVIAEQVAYWPFDGDLLDQGPDEAFHLGGLQYDFVESDDAQCGEALHIEPFGEVATGDVPSAWEGCESFGGLSSGGPANRFSYCASRVDSWLKWDDAQADCEANGAHLVAINDADEDAWIHEFAQTVFYRSPGQFDYWEAGAFWIGAYQEEGSVEPLGGWGWVNGDPFDYTHWQPEDLDFDPESTKSCGGMWAAMGPYTLWGDPTSLWHWRDCETYEMSYVCEEEISPEEADGLTLTPAYFPSQSQTIRFWGRPVDCQLVELGGTGGETTTVDGCFYISKSTHNWASEYSVYTQGGRTATLYKNNGSDFVSTFEHPEGLEGWHQFTAVSDTEAGEMRLLLDGAVSSAGPTIFTGFGESDTRLTLGTNPNGSYDYSSIDMDELEIFSCAIPDEITASEVACGGCGCENGDVCPDENSYWDGTGCVAAE